MCDSIGVTAERVPLDTTIPSPPPLNLMSDNYVPSFRDDDDKESKT